MTNAVPNTSSWPPTPATADIKSTEPRPLPPLRSRVPLLFRRTCPARSDWARPEPANGGNKLINNDNSQMISDTPSRACSCGGPAGVQCVIIITIIITRAVVLLSSLGLSRPLRGQLVSSGALTKSTTTTTTTTTSPEARTGPLSL